MGYYVEVPAAKGKANLICRMYDGAKIVTEAEAKSAVQLGEGVVVVVDNGPFEAAAFAFSAQEFSEFTRRDDHRPKTFVLMDSYEQAARASGYGRH